LRVIGDRMAYGDAVGPVGHERRDIRLNCCRDGRGWQRLVQRENTSQGWTAAHDEQVWDGKAPSSEQTKHLSWHLAAKCTACTSCRERRRQLCRACLKEKAGTHSGDHPFRSLSRSLAYYRIQQTYRRIAPESFTIN
jgi:hypothetical protein